MRVFFRKTHFCYTISAQDFAKTCLRYKSSFADYRNTFADYKSSFVFLVLMP